MTDNQITINTSGTAKVYYKLCAMDVFDLESGFSNTVSTNTLIIPKESIDLSQNNLGELPKEFTLEQNYPNPFNPATDIRYNLPQAGWVSIKIYNLLGEEVRTLVNEFSEAGFLSLQWDGKDGRGFNVQSGIYIYKIDVTLQDTNALRFSHTRKMMLIR